MGNSAFVNSMIISLSKEVSIPATTFHYVKYNLASRDAIGKGG